MASGGNPFATSAANVHTGFTPTRLGPIMEATSSGGHERSHSMPIIPPPKPPKPPEKPLVPYMRFSRQMWHKVRDENPECQLWDIGRKIGALWRDLPDNEKLVYQEQWEGEKVDFDRQMKAYHNSPAYQAYLAAKNQGTKSASSSRERHQHHVQQHPVRVESGVFIQAVDEDDGEHQLSVRKLAATRFDRNQRLIGDLFSDTVVQDTRTVVTQSRLHMLRKQASSLMTHQNKMEEELVGLEKKFQDKKRSIQECSQAFAEKLKKVCEEKPVVEEEKYQEMVATASRRLLAAYDLFKQRQVELAQAQENKNLSPTIQPTEQTKPADEEKKDEEELKEAEEEPSDGDDDISDEDSD